MRGNPASGEGVRRRPRYSHGVQSISFSPAAPRFILPRHRIGVVLALLASAATLFPWLIDSGPSLRYAIDIDVYREGAKAFLAGDNLYTRSYSVGGIELPFTYPPLAAILFIPLALVPYGVALVGTGDYVAALEEQLASSSPFCEVTGRFVIPDSDADTEQLPSDALARLQETMERRGYDVIVIGVPASHAALIKRAIKSLVGFSSELLLCTEIKTFGVMINESRSLGRLRADIINVVAHEPDAKLLIASKAGYGFVAPENDLLAQKRGGKQVLNGEALLCRRVTGDHVAVVGQNRKLLVFPLSELPEMARGKGVRLQKYKDGGLSDAICITLAEGLRWQETGGRTRSEPDLSEWLGKRAGAGYMAPRGFPRDNRFN